MNTETPIQRTQRLATERALRQTGAQLAASMDYALAGGLTHTVNRSTATGIDLPAIRAAIRSSRNPYPKIR